MQDISSQKLIELYRALPKDVLEVYEGAGTGDILLDIGKKHALALDKVGNLTYQTGLIMIGATPVRDYVKNIEEALDVPHEKAVEIASDVNHRLFAPIRESLKRIHNIEPRDALLEEPAARAESPRPQMAARPAPVVITKVPFPPAPAPPTQKTTEPGGSYWKELQQKGVATTKTGSEEGRAGNGDKGMGNRGNVEEKVYVKPVTPPAVPPTVEVSASDKKPPAPEEKAVPVFVPPPAPSVLPKKEIRLSSQDSLEKEVGAIIGGPVAGIREREMVIGEREVKRTEPPIEIKKEIEPEINIPPNPVVSATPLVNALDSIKTKTPEIKPAPPRISHRP